MQRPWRDGPKPGGYAGRWMLRAIFAAIAAIIAVTVLATFLVWQRRPPWWVGDGLAADPGYFVRKLAIDYPICAPLLSPGLPGLHQTEQETSEPIAGSAQVNLGLLLPKKARIDRILCAVGPPGQAMRECGARHCDPPMTFFAMDSLYTGGRVLVFTLQNKNPHATRPVNIDIRVLWR